MFEQALAKVLVHEGGYVNHPKDPGGATNKGITQRVYDNYRARVKKPKQSVRNITDIEVATIYRQQYWVLAKCDKLPAGVDYVVFDGAVNSGVSQSVKWLQRALGVRADGVIGNMTLKAVDDHPNHDELIAKICERRMAFLRALKTWKHFGKGWASRVNGVKKVGQAWATGAEAPQVTYLEGANAKASLVDAKRAPSTAPGDIGAGAGGITALLTQTQEQLLPFTTIEFVAQAAAILTIAGATVAIGGFMYRAWAKRKEREIRDALDLEAA